MPRKLFKSVTPSPEALRSGWLAKTFGKHLHAHDLWHLHRHTVSMGFFVGVFVAFIPIPGQMLVAAALAMLLRCHLPIAVISVWLSNPFTMPAIFYGNYLLGTFLLQTPAITFENGITFSLLKEALPTLWKPLFIGSFVAAFFFGSLSYAVVRLGWRARVIYLWQKRNKP